MADLDVAKISPKFNQEWHVSGQILGPDARLNRDRRCAAERRSEITSASPATDKREPVGLRQVIEAIVQRLVGLLPFRARMEAYCWLGNLKIKQLLERLGLVMECPGSKRNGFHRAFNLDLSSALKPVGDFSATSSCMWSSATKDHNAYCDWTDPKSEWYQSWIGARIIADGKDECKTLADVNGEVPLEIQMKIDECEQTAALKMMGDLNPIAKDRHIATHRWKINGVERTVYECSMDTHSLLSAKPNIIQQLMGKVPAREWENDLSSFHDVHLKGFLCGYYDPELKRVICMYACATSYRRKDGTVVDYTAQTRDRIVEMFKTLKPAPAKATG